MTSIINFSQKASENWCYRSNALLSQETNSQWPRTCLFQPSITLFSNPIKAMARNNYLQLRKSKSLHLHDSKLTKNSNTSFLRYIFVF